MLGKINTNVIADYSPQYLLVLAKS